MAYPYYTGFHLNPKFMNGESGDNLILIQIEPPEIRVAEMRDGKLFDLEVDRAGRVLGDIYKGRVENVLPGMDGAFVDIGLKRNALIYVGDVEIASSNASPKNQKITQLLRSGDELIVQVARPPVGGKGARVTTRLSLPGRFVLLMSPSDSVGVSKRIESDKERKRLRKMAERMRPLGHGLILRTEAEGASEADLERDIQFLHQQLQRIRQRAVEVSASALLHRESDLMERVARDKVNDGVRAVWLDTEEAFRTFQELVRLFAPHLAERVQLYGGVQPLFEKFGASEAIRAATERTIELTNGGTLVVDETEALIAIDVNTGRFTGKSQLADTVLQTNMLAVEEIARQLRLRNLGGVIVIDFIDMPRTRDRVKVLNALEAALRHDRTRTRIVNISPSGLVEMTRRREGYSLRQLLHENCSYCGGDGVVERASTVAINARRRVRTMCRQNDNRHFEVTLHPEAACALLGPNDELIQELEAATGAKIALHADPKFHVEASEVVASMQASESKNPDLGARLYLTKPSVLYPHRQPRFFVLENRFVRLQNSIGSFASDEMLPPCVIEITGVGSWFLSAKVIAEKEGEKEWAERDA